MKSFVCRTLLSHPKLPPTHFSSYVNRNRKDDKAALSYCLLQCGGGGGTSLYSGTNFGDGDICLR